MKTRFTPDEFMLMLTELSARLHKSGRFVEFVLFGGGALSLYYGSREQTKDLDVAFQAELTDQIGELVRTIGHQFHADSDWLNRKGAFFLTQSMQDEALDFLSLPGLRVKVLRPEALLALKIASARIFTDTPDLDDLRFLLHHLEIRDVDAALAIAREQLPELRTGLQAASVVALEAALRDE
ncbi:MAG: nucleotidyltransferase [Actinomycetes bacterium]|jgi:predicted nucleotidyltransferase|nr:nucleotidyltransferase [Actinomycetes bacterium]